MKRLIAIVLLLSLLCGCSSGFTLEKKQYTATFLDVFDTVTTITGKDISKAAFEEKARAVHDTLLEYHRLFDIYNDYDGLHNLKTVNDAAGGEPVAVDGRIIQLLMDCKRYYDLTGGRVNVAMGSVLGLWHDARTHGINDPLNAKLPDRQALEDAAAHGDMDAVVIDEAASTVCITDPLLRLDVGAVAKGWAAQQAAQTAPEGLLISVGGNVCSTGAKDELGSPWIIGIQDPDGGDSYLHTIYLQEGSVVTSGDYQRTYRVGQEYYHHIIDPDTLFPARYWRSVTIICKDSALADALSTALFLMPLEEGKALAEKLQVDVLWVDENANTFCTPGFESIKRT